MEFGNILNLRATDNYETNGTTYTDALGNQVLSTNGLGQIDFVQPGFLNDQLKIKQLGLMNTQQKNADLANQMYTDKINSPMYKAMPYFQGFGLATQGLGSLANIYSGFQQLKLAREQTDMARDQWNETKNEIARIKKVRDNLNTSYMS